MNVSAGTGACYQSGRPESDPKKQGIREPAFYKLLSSTFQTHTVALCPYICMHTKGCKKYKQKCNKNKLINKYGGSSTIAQQVKALLRQPDFNAWNLHNDGGRTGSRKLSSGPSVCDGTGSLPMSCTTIMHISKF